MLSGDRRVSELVVLLLRHSDAGSQGVMLNRPCFANVGDLLGWGYAVLCCVHVAALCIRALQHGEQACFTETCTPQVGYRCSRWTHL